MFASIDFTNFWDEDDYYKESCTGKTLNNEMIVEAEQVLGYRLPNSYKEFMKKRNGRKLIKAFFVSVEKRYCVELGVFFSISKEKQNSLFGEFSNGFWFEMWEYPSDIGVIIEDTISARHEMIYLDYRECERNGEPKVCICLQESNFETIHLANNFEEFVNNLKSEDEVIALIRKSKENNANR